MASRKTSPRRYSFRHAYSLIDTLLAVSLLAVFSLLAFRLIYANFNVVQTTLSADANTARFDRAVGQLRADVSNSKTLQLPQPGLLRMESTNSQIAWQSDATTLTRRERGQVRTWDVGQPITLKLDGAVALLSISPTDQIALTGPTPGGLK